LHIRSGETLAGRIIWWDLGAAALQLDGGELLVVQRHAVIDWRAIEIEGAEGERGESTSPEAAS
jgi:hypothetical protein